MPPSPAPSSGALHPIVFYPPYDSRAGYLLGAARAGAWLDAASAADLLGGDERYAMYADHVFLTAGVGEAPGPSSPVCPALRTVTLVPLPPVRPVLAIGGNWNALPRQPQDIPTDHEFYRDATEALLRSHGITGRAPHLTRVLRVDLDGDGDEEVILAATDFVEATGHDVFGGDYSLVAVRALGPEGVATLPLVADYYGAARQNAFPLRYNLIGVYDLNGDGRLEVVVGVTGWERVGAIAFSVRDNTVEGILTALCWH